MAPLQNEPLFRLLLDALRHHPGWTLVPAAAFTAVVHSSATTLALLLGLAHEGLLDPRTAIPVIRGEPRHDHRHHRVRGGGAAGGAAGRRPPVVSKAIGTALAFPLTGPFADLVARTSDDIARQVANAHAVFNVCLALALLPFSGVLVALVRWVLPPRPAAAEPFGPRHLDESVLASPPVAFAQTTRETLRMADIVQGMLRDTIRTFQGHDAPLVQRIEETDDRVDRLDREIKLFLTKLSRAALTEAQARREVELIAFSADLEAVGDIIDKNLMELAKKRTRRGLVFSDEGWREIVDFHQKVCENFELAVRAFATRDPGLARKLLRHKVRINSHITNVAYPILDGVDDGRVDGSGCRNGGGDGRQSATAVGRAVERREPLERRPRAIGLRGIRAALAASTGIPRPLAGTPGVTGICRCPVVISRREARAPPRCGSR